MRLDPLGRYEAMDREFPVPADVDGRLRERMYEAYEDAVAAGPAPELVDDLDGPVIDLRHDEGRAPRPAQPNRWMRPLIAAAVLLVAVGVAWMLTQDDGADDVSTADDVAVRSVVGELSEYCTAVADMIDVLPWRFDTGLPTFPSARAQLDELIEVHALAVDRLPAGGGVAAEDAAIAALDLRLENLADELDALIVLADNAQWNEVARGVPSELRELEVAISELGELGVEECLAVVRDANGEGGS